MTYKKVILRVGMLALSSVQTVKNVLTLKEQAAKAYFITRPVSVIRKDFEGNKLNQELQRLLVPLVIKKYKNQLDRQFNKILKGHSSFIVALAISSDGNYALTGSLDTTARLWDLQTSKTRTLLKGHAGSVNALVFSSDNACALTGSTDNTARLWDLTTGQTIQILMYNSHIQSVAISPDGTRALTGCNDHKALIWDLKTGEIITVLEGHTSKVVSVDFTADGKHALTRSCDGILYLWELKDSQMVDNPIELINSYINVNVDETTKALVAHLGCMSSVTLACDKRYVLTTSGSVAYFWDLDYYRNVVSLKEVLDKIKPFACEAPCTVL